MIHQFVVLGIIASPLALFVLKKLSQRKQSKSSLQNQQAKSPGNSDYSSKRHGRSDVVIVGAGVAGSALAYALGKDGHRVHIIERDLTTHDRMIGEVLQPGGYLKLLELGLEDCVLDIDAQLVFGYVIYKDGKYVKLPYPLDSSNSHVTGRSFHNGRFVQKLREKAASLPNVEFEQGTVLGLLKQKDTVKGVRYKTKTGQERVAHADLTVICDGRYSNLRRFCCSHKIKVTSHFVGWITEMGQLPFANYGHIILAEPSTVSIFQISDTQIRCFVDAHGHKAPSISNSEMSHYLKTMVAPQIPPEFYETFMSTIDKATVRTIPHWKTSPMTCPPNPIPGAFLLGDALHVQHPFSGGGMTVALSDIVVLRDLLRSLHSLHDTSSVSGHLQSFYTLRRPMAITMDTMAALFQSAFCNNSSALLREANVKENSFRFLCLGGVCGNALMSLVSGINPNTSTLLLLLLTMAVYNLAQLLLPFPSPRSFKLGWRMILRAASFIFTTLKLKRKAAGIMKVFLPRKGDEAIPLIE